MRTEMVHSIIEPPGPQPSGAPRVILLTSPGLFGAEIINRLAAEEGTQLVGVGLTDRLYKGRGFLSSVRLFARRTGWRYLWYSALQSQVAWIQLRCSGRPRGLIRVADHVRRLRDVNAAETVDWIRGLAPDYVASFFFNQLIGSEVRRIPVRACVNMHPSLLPRLRGPDPVFRALERGITTSGYTIHEIADAVDAGPILFQKACEIPEKVTAFGLYLKMIREGADLLASWLAGRLAASENLEMTSCNGDYQTFPNSDEVRRFYRSGRRLIRLGELRRALADIR